MNYYNEIKEKLINNEEIKLVDYVKEPILIKNSSKLWSDNRENFTKAYFRRYSIFFKRIRDGFTFIDNEYKIKLGTHYNYIDLLLYNIKFKSYVVIEIKVTELKKEHIGQLETYMNYIDKNLKTIEEDKTIGIILVKKNNKYIMEYCSDERIITKRYELI